MKNIIIFVLTKQSIMKHTITANEVVIGTFGLPTWIINSNKVQLCYGSWIIEDGEREYVPVLVDGQPKLMSIDSDSDCDGTFYSFWFTDSADNAEYGQEVRIDDYLKIAIHIGHSIYQEA